MFNSFGEFYKGVEYSLENVAGVFFIVKDLQEVFFSFRFLTRLKHPNCIKYHGCYLKEQTVWVSSPGFFFLSSVLGRFFCSWVILKLLVLRLNDLNESRTQLGKKRNCHLPVSELDR
jgi:hypothetical protein